MATYEQDIVMFETKENGDKTIKMPISRVNNIEGIGRSISTAYVVGDVVYVDNNKKVALKCTTAGTTSSSELDVSSKAVGNTVTDGGVVWQVCNRTSDVTSVNGKTGDVVVDLPVGHMYFSVEPNVPVGRLPAMGATYNRSLYADLWAWANSVGLVKSESEWQAIASANDGNCAYYSSGDGSSTFRVPSIRCWVKGANNVDEVGSYLQAGLPAINGKIFGSSEGGDSFSMSTPRKNIVSGSGGSAPTVTNGYWDTSRNWVESTNIIYGNSETVQPPSLVGMWVIVAFGTVSNVGNADVSNVMQAVEQVQTGLGTLEQGVEQVQTGLGTLEQGVGTAIDYIVESYRNGTEWYEVYKSGKVRQGGRNTKSKVTLLKSFADTNYSVFLTADNDDSGNNPRIAAINKTTTTFTWYNGNWSYNGYWQAEGQGA